MKSIDINHNAKRVHIVRENETLDIIAFHNFAFDLKNILTENSGLYVIYDATKVKIETLGEVRLAMGEWMKENEQLIIDNVDHMIVIVPSFVVQMMVKAVLAIKNIPIPYKIFTKVEQAEKFIELKHVV